MQGNKGNSVETLLTTWGEKATIALKAHYDASRYCSRRNYGIGIPAIALATIVGSSVFASLQREFDNEYKILVGLLSISAAVLSALQTFLGYGERAERHRVAAARYGSIKREIESLLVTSIENTSKEQVSMLKDRIDKLAEESPGLPRKFWDIAVV